MNILVNDKVREVKSPVLHEALLELGYGNTTIATAVNGEFISIKAREQTQLQANDRLEIVAPMQGG